MDIKRGILQGDSLSPLLFVITMIPLTLILRKCEAGYYYGNNVKINHPLFMDNLKLCAETSNQGGKRPGSETGSPLLGQCVMQRRTGTSAPSALLVQ